MKPLPGHRYLQYIIQLKWNGVNHLFERAERAERAILESIHAQKG